MRPTPRVWLLSALLAASASAGAEEPPVSDGAVLRLQVVAEKGNVDGTGVLVHREDRATGVVLYFVTSARLLEDPEGGLPPRTQLARVFLDGGHTLDVARDDIFVCPWRPRRGRASGHGENNAHSASPRRQAVQIPGYARTSLMPASSSASGSGRHSSSSAIAMPRRWSAASELQQSRHAARSASSASARQAVHRRSPFLSTTPSLNGPCPSAVLRPARKVTHGWWDRAGPRWHYRLERGRV